MSAGAGHRTDRARTLALAGLLQALSLVQEVARTGKAPEEAMAASLGSLLETEPADVDAVYGGPAGVALGLRRLRQVLDGSRPDPELLRYAAAVLNLERKLRRDPERLAAIRRTMERAREQRAHFPVTHPNLVAALADCYVQHISTLGPRILVKGDPAQLVRPEVAQRIRALLLAAIRSAVLWRQCGGSRLQLLLGRGRILRCARELAAGAA